MKYWYIGTGAIRLDFIALFRSKRDGLSRASQRRSRRFDTEENQNNFTTIFNHEHPNPATPAINQYERLRDAANRM
jgi:hypothetical protein